MITNSEMGESALNASLRPVVAVIERDLAHLADGTLAQMRAGMDQLRESWGQLVSLLALGPVPELRECPVCRHRGMRAAIRCGFCWTALTALAGARDEPSSAESHGGG